MEYIIVVDSCGEIPEELKQDKRLASAPLTMRVGNEEIIDDENFDQASFLKKVAECPECPKSACPSPDYYQNAYDCGAKHIYAVTLSAELSGSYNSALLGMDLFKEEHPDVKGHVFNSRSASVGETLIALKIMELEDQGLPFEKVVEQTEQNQGYGCLCFEDQTDYGCYKRGSYLSVGTGQRNQQSSGENGGCNHCSYC